MSKVKVDEKAPNFTLPDVDGRERSLYEFLEKSHVVLVLNRGFS